ncbi:peptidoglycan editing factor PgeF [Candidatus Albibeggiatoa sp. nov. NOAA]|uniref:peptidoglycan editing factor PgeF n=1 Tax=Candidatus Albibeggiatoa sp. nov. NOAA TaxID=3162724 RepID=UPI0032F4AAFF|nr:peptidoglycan editing factor PgeF [Thiotrichaceae bacterium]
MLNTVKCPIVFAKGLTMSHSYLTPNWPAPESVKAYVTTRIGGFSHAPFDGFNLATHVGDHAETVAKNRALLAEHLQLPQEPVWLEQVHGVEAVAAESVEQGYCADAIYTEQIGNVCVVMTADCLPVFFCNRQGTKVAVAHAGWRGLANGVLESTVQSLGGKPEDILVWLGPAISQAAFEVGDEVRQAFADYLPQAEQAFKPSRPNHWYADLYLLAKQCLQVQGIQQIFGGDLCTYTDNERFFSYRRDQQTGRMASLIWLQS